MELLKRRWRLLCAAAAVVTLGSVVAFVGAVRAQGPAEPANSSPPIVLGSFMVGSTLSLLPGSWSGEPAPVFTYQWLSCAAATDPPGDCDAISGATGATYVPVGADESRHIRVRVTGANASGFAIATSEPVGPIVAASNAPLNLFSPSIQGPAPPQIGEPLTAQAGVWNAPLDQTAFQWLRCDSAGENCAPIGGATQAAYTPVQADAGSTLRVLVSVEATGGGKARAVSSQTQTIAIGPVNTAPPVITGTAQEGQLLSASTGTWTSPDESPITFAYQWQRCNAEGSACQNIAGATQQTYAVQQGDVGSRLVVVVTATNAQGPQSQSSAPTAVVTGIPAGATIPVTQVVLPNQLVISAVQFQPSVLRSRAPFTARFRVSDTGGRFVSGAVVNLVVVPFGRVAPPGTATTDQDGWATFTLRPTSKFPLVKGFLITMQARAVKPGDVPFTHGVTAWRLASVRINPNL